MNLKNLNISISGLSSTISDDLKIRLRKNLPRHIGINWTIISDPDVDCILINENFFESHNIQNIIQNRKVPFLKISKNSICDDENLITIPIVDECKLINWINEKLLCHTENVNQKESMLSHENLSQIQVREINYFSDIYDKYDRKIILSDNLGTIAIVDNYAHLAWLEATRDEFEIGHSVHYQAATIEDFIKISRKRQFNLENWLFNLIWKNPHLIALPEADKSYRLKFWIQPNESDKKILLKLNACFILGAKIKHVAEKLNISEVKIQHFIAANFAIHNVDVISTKEIMFDKNQNSKEIIENKGLLKNFFNIFKSKFKF